jgi:hypothetical protein
MAARSEVAADGIVRCSVRRLGTVCRLAQAWCDKARGPRKVFSLGLIDHPLLSFHRVGRMVRRQQEGNWQCEAQQHAGYGQSGRVTVA